MKLGIRSKLFLISLSLIIASLGIGYGALTPAVSRFLTRRIGSDLAVRLELVTRIAATADLAPDDRPAWAQLAAELGRLAQARVTLLDANSEVQADSEVLIEAVPQLENHRDRPEIIGALRNGRGHSTRPSRTLGVGMHYVAARFYSAQKRRPFIDRKSVV